MMRSLPSTSSRNTRPSTPAACRWCESRALLLEDQLAALHLEAFQPAEEAHAEQVGVERTLLGDRGLHIAHADVVDAHAVERHRSHARDAIGGLGEAGIIEAVRR